LKPLIESVYLSTYSYVKPGAPHRFSTYFLNLHSIVHTFTSAIGEYLRSIEVGYQVSEGKLGFNKVPVGDLISNALHSSSKRLGPSSFQELHLVMIPTVIAASYSLKLRGRSEGFSKAFLDGLRNTILYNDVRETVKVYTALRDLGGRYSSIINSLALTASRIEVEAASLSDLLSDIGRSDKAVYAFNKLYMHFIDLSNKFINYYVDSRDLNYAATATYALIVKNLLGITFNPKIKTRGDLLKLLKLDKEFHDKGLELSYLLPVLTAVTFIGLARLGI